MFKPPTAIVDPTDAEIEANRPPCKVPGCDGLAEKRNYPTKDGRAVYATRCRDCRKKGRRTT